MLVLTKPIPQVSHGSAAEDASISHGDVVIRINAIDTRQVSFIFLGIFLSKNCKEMSKKSLLLEVSVFFLFPRIFFLKKVSLLAALVGVVARGIGSLHRALIEP